MKNKLVGKKTYLVAFALALATFAQAVGWIDQNVYEAVIGFMGALGLGALRAGVSKLMPKDSEIETPQEMSINLERIESLYRR